MSLHSSKLSWCALLFASLAGCATTQIDGFDLYQGDYDHSKAEVIHLATRDMSCEAGGLQLVVKAERGHQPSQIEVRGCGRTSLYVRQQLDGWEPFVRERTRQQSTQTLGE